MTERLDKRLTALYSDFSRARLEGLVKAGFVKVNGVIVTKAGAKVHDDDIIDVFIPPPVPAEPEPEAIPLDILFEDDELLVVNKPAGLVVHPAPGHFTGTLVNAVLNHCPNLKGIGGVARPGIVHRLDQDTSGVMVIAKSQCAMTALVKAFSSHKDIEKTYLAIVRGSPTLSSGRIENFIGRSPYDRKKMAIVERNGKRAVTRYEVLGSTDSRAGNPLSLIRCDIETGRTHQIRVHMKSLGCPIVGDAVYGNSADDHRLNPPPQRQLLHAWRLILKHPTTGKLLTFTAPLPADFSFYLSDQLIDGRIISS